MKTTILSPALAVCLAILTLAQVRAASPDAAWSANWIGPGKSGLNQWTRYLRSFDLSEVPPQARARIAVDSKYRLWLNGELLVREGGLKRGPNPEGTYHDVVDLAPALNDWQRSDGILYSPVPAGLSKKGSRRGPHDRTWYWELPVQMLASVGKYGLWTYYLQTADKETIAHAYPAVRRYLDIWQLDDRGLVIHRPGDWNWLDWGKNIDVPLLVNAWFILALDGAIEMALLTGNDADVPRWQALRERVAAAYNPTFWTGKEYRSPGYSGDTDDRGNALAVVAGLAEPGQFPALIQILTKHRNASQWMEKYVLERDHPRSLECQ